LSLLENWLQYNKSCSMPFSVKNLLCILLGPNIPQLESGDSHFKYPFTKKPNYKSIKYSFKKKMNEQTPQHDTSSSKSEPLPAYQKVIIRPIQANLREANNILTKMDPYCIVKIGHRKKKTEAAKNTGRYPFLNSALSLKLKEKDYLCTVIVKNRKHGFIGKTITRQKLIWS